MTNDLNPAGVEERDLYYYDELLAPCPLCGSKAFMDGRWAACCSNEGCLCGTVAKDTSEEAIAAWNRRASLPQPEGETAELVERLRTGVLADDASGSFYAATADATMDEAADAITSLSQRAAVAEEAENEAKDLFWAIYPEWVKFTGLSLSTEAARTSLSQRLAAQAFEIEMLTRGGIIEVAVRNPSVADYMKRWEGRVEKAEARHAVVEAERDEWKAAAMKSSEQLAKSFGVEHLGWLETWKARAEAAEAQLAHAREAAIEECAKVADNHGLAEDGNPDCQGCGEEIAAALRALGGGK